MAWLSGLDLDLTDALVSAACLVYSSSAHNSTGQGQSWELGTYPRSPTWVVLNTSGVTAALPLPRQDLH